MSDTAAWRALRSLGMALTVGSTLWTYRQLHRTRLARRLAEDRLATLVATSTDAVVVVDEAGTIGWTSPGATTLIGPVGGDDTLLSRVFPQDREEVARALGRGRGEGIPVRLCGPGDRRSEAEVSVVDRRTDPSVGGLVVTLRQPLSPADALRWRHQALHDDLTNLANRGGLFESLELLADPTASGRSCAVLYADLDDFKSVNDTWGHAAGDRVLVTVAERLRHLVRPGDTVARIGGDEFVVVIDAVGDDLAALVIAERVRQSLGEPIALEHASVTVTVTASFGIAVGDDRHASVLLNHADVALYEAKRAGRNRCCVWNPSLRAPDPERATFKEPGAP